MPPLRVIAAILSGFVVLSSCAQSAHQVSREKAEGALPPELEQQIDRTVAFPDLLATPAQYVGRVVMFGGIVLSAKRTTTKTEIEVLELPSQAGAPKPAERFQSQGRFLAVQEAFLDPAIVAPGTPLTVIGEVKGHSTRRLDESEYAYPVLEIKHLINWNMVTAEEASNNAGASYRPYYPYYAPFSYWGGPYGPYPYSYYGGLYPPFIIQQPPPPPPPPQRIPPQFRKK